MCVCERERDGEWSDRTSGTFARAREEEDANVRDA